MHFTWLNTKLLCHKIYRIVSGYKIRSHPVKKKRRIIVCRPGLICQESKDCTVLTIVPLANSIKCIKVLEEISNTEKQWLHLTHVSCAACGLVALRFRSCSGLRCRG